MIKGYIFDLDGTLLDSLDAWENIGNRYLASLDIQGYPDLDQRVEHMSLKEAATYLKKEFHLEASVDEIVVGVRLQIEEKYKNDIPLKEGVKEFIETCYKKGIVMCVLTASSSTLAKHALQRLGVAEYFKNIYSCQICGYSKTEKESYLSVAHNMNLKVEECVVVEDALYAIETATQAGFCVKAVYDKHNEKDWQKICQIADKNYQSFKEMEI